jgi:hypothetical protein
MKNVKYSIKPIPTIYNSILFRSRLEAKWACFFDYLGWEYDYEPFDLFGTIDDGNNNNVEHRWTPDFILKGKENILVEVKPINFDFKKGIKDIEIFKKAFKSYPIHNYKYILCLGSNINNAEIGLMLVKGENNMFMSHNAFVDALICDKPTRKNYYGLNYDFDIPTTSFNEKFETTWDALDTKYIFSQEQYAYLDSENYYCILKRKEFNSAYNEFWKKAANEVMFKKPNHKLHDFLK